MRFSFSVLVNRVTALQEDHVKEERVRTLLEAQCEYLQEQLNDARAHIEAYRNETKDLLKHSKKEEDQLHGKIDQLQYEGVAARMQADKLAGSLENVLASREQALRTAKERCRIAEHALALKLDECKRLQEQQSSFSELMTTLEAELRSANESLSQARTMVTDNRQAIQKHKAWMQAAMVREELLIEKLDENAAALATERQQHTETKKALSNQTDRTAALLLEKDGREAEVEELLAERTLLRKEVAGHQEHHIKAQQHFKRSNELLQSAKDAIQSHEVALDSMKSRLAAIDNSKAESAAADALKLVEQEQEVTSLRAELAAISKRKAHSTAADALKLAEQEQELISLRADVAALKGRRMQSASAAPADSMGTPAAVSALAATPKGAEQGKPAQGEGGHQNVSKGKTKTHEAEQEIFSTGTAKSLGKTSLGNQEVQTASTKADKLEQGPAKGSISQQPRPMQQIFTDAGSVLGKRGRVLLLPALNPPGLLQLAADTPDELEVLSDNHSSAEEQPSPAKKTCLQPGPSNNQDSLHRQPSPRAREHTIGEMNAPEQFAEKVSARRPGTLLSSNMGVTQPAAAATQNGRAETDDGEAIPSAQILQKQPSIAVPKIQTEKAAERTMKESNPKAAADKYLSALIEGVKVEQPSKTSQADVFDAFAAFEGLGQDD